MEPKAFEEKLREKIAEMRLKLTELRRIADEKKTEEPALNMDTGITVHETAEALERSIEEAEAKIDTLGEVTVEAWQERGQEIQSDYESMMDSLKDRFEALAEALKD